jgi:phage terminase small subunit
MGLTKKQKVFVEEYLQSWNATESAIRAGYSKKSAYSIGSENLKKPVIAEEIQSRLDAMVMSADETLVSLSKIARGDMSDFLSLDSNEHLLDFKQAQRRGSITLIKKFKIGKHGIEFELYDKQAALNTLAKHHGLLKERIEIDVNLVAEAIGALEALGQDPAAIFNEIIARAKLKQDATG